MPRKTHKQFEKEIFNKWGGEYSILERYAGNKNKILVRHNKCGYEYKVTPNNLLRGKGCPNCKFKKISRIKTKKHEIFVIQVKNLYNGEYTPVGKYKKSRTKILMKHNKCGFEWYVTPELFLHGSTCPRCRIEEKSKTTEQFKQEIYNKYGNEYKILGEYINSKTKIRVIHKICGYQWDVIPGNLLSGKSICPYCSKKIRKNTIIFKNEVYNKTNGEYSVMGKYINAKTKIMIKHNVCGYEWKIIPDAFLNSNVRCPRCNSSKGEDLISNYLTTLGIKYIREYSFDDCKDKGKLFFDFAIFDDDGNLLGLIEYQGIQHYEPIEYFGGVEMFIKQQERDKIKYLYAKEHNIPLFYIPYWEFDNIENILRLQLNTILAGDF